MLALVNRGTFDSATGGTFQSDTDGTFHSDIPGTFESDMDGTFKVLQSKKNNFYENEKGTFKNCNLVCTNISVFKFFVFHECRG